MPRPPPPPYLSQYLEQSPVRGLHPRNPRFGRELPRIPGPPPTAPEQPPFRSPLDQPGPAPKGPIGHQPPTIPKPPPTRPDQDPLTAMWMLSNQSRPTPSSTAAQGEAASVLTGTPQSDTATYDQPSASPVSDDANPFSSLAMTLRHDSFAQRFPWLGE